MRALYTLCACLLVVGPTVAAGAIPTVELAWRVETGAAVRSAPAISGDSVFVGNAAGEVQRLNRSDGAVVWRAHCGAAVASRIVVTGTKVLVTARDGLYAFDRDNGRQLWRVPTRPQPLHPLGWDFWLASPLVVGSRVYIGFGDGTFGAWDLASGESVWRRDMGARLRATAALADGRLLVPAFDGRVYALDADDGHELWRFDTAGVALDPEDTRFDRRSLQARPVMNEDTAFFGSRDGHFYAVDVTTGRERWRVDEEVSWVLGAALPFRDTIIVPTSDGHRVHAVDRSTGAERWSHPLAARALVDLALMGPDTVVVGETTGILHGLDAATGQARWRFFADDTILSAPACADREVAFGSDSGAVYLVAVSPARGAPAGPVDRAVYYDERLPFRWSAHDRPIRDAFAAAGYTVVPASDIATFLRSHADGKRSGVLVLATDVLPTSALAADGEGVPLLRRFIAAGGRVVSLGAPPGLMQLDLEGGKAEVASPDELEQLIGVRLRSRFSDTSPASITPAGTRHCLWGGLAGSWGVDPESVDEVLATDEWGGAVAWRRDLGAGEIVQVLGRNALPTYLPSALNLAEAGLPPPPAAPSQS